MSLTYEPEFAAAIAPLAEIFAALPQHPVGDALSRREGANQMFNQRNALLPDQPDVKRTNHAVKTTDGATINVAQFSRQDVPPASKALYYIHGGGMILGSVDIFEKSIARRAAETGLPVFAVGYRLAPEHPHPTPVTDCWTGLQWLSSHAKELGVDPARIVIIGESAGGGLAAGTTLLARDNKLSPPLLKQILVYPMLDDRNMVPFADIEPFATWKCNDNITGWRALLGDVAGSTEPNAVSEYAAPARAKNLAGLPPTFIECGQLDIFVFEDIAFASRLIQARVPVELHIYPGTPHGFQSLGPNTSTTQASLANVARAIANA